MNAQSLYRCSHWPEHGKRCELPAVGILITPRGKPCPGGYSCEEHAQAVITEYQDKLGETWTLDRKAVSA